MGKFPEDNEGTKFGAFGWGTFQRANISATGSVAISNAVAAGTQAVEIMVTADAYVAIGSSATASSSNRLLPAYVPFGPIRVQGGSDKIAALSVTATGALEVQELT